jgi:DNA-binding transcriptional MerR regulator
MEEMRVEPFRGVYDANRAAVLAGVPKTTLHRWARTQLLVPSVSPNPRTRLWSWGDLLALRAVDWLRREKPDAIPAVPLTRVRRALSVLEQHGIPAHALSDAAGVTQSGQLYVAVGDGVIDPRDGQAV